MTILNNGNKEIKIDCSKSGVKEEEIITKKHTYTIILPEITCSDKYEAEQMEMKITEYIRTLTKEILNRKD